MEEDKKTKVSTSSVTKPKASGSKGSTSTAPNAEDPMHHDDNTRPSSENACQLGPNKPYSIQVITEILKNALSSNLQHETYETEWSRQMTKTLCDVIKARVKEHVPPHYRIVVNVHIGQVEGQSIQISSQCLWDSTTDSVASYSFKNSSLFSVAIVFVIF